MLLAIDVGNTQTVLGVYDGEHLEHMWRIATASSQTSDELRISLHGLFAMTGISIQDIDGVALCAVVPALNRLWKKVGADMFGRRVLAVDAKAARDLIDTSMYRHADLGADRVADAVAARVLYGSPVIVLDFGTATNMEVIDREGKFQGGIIAPGVETSMKALFSRAALLPEVELTDPQTAIGRDTIKAIQVGVVYGEADRVDGLVHRVWNQLGYETAVVATGGLSTSIAKLCSTVTAVNPELTLQGLRIIYEQHNR